MSRIGFYAALAAFVLVLLLAVPADAGATKWTVKGKSGTVSDTLRAGVEGRYILFSFTRTDIKPRRTQHQIVVQNWKRGTRYRSPGDYVKQTYPKYKHVDVMGTFTTHKAIAAKRETIANKLRKHPDHSTWIPNGYSKYFIIKEAR